MPLTVWTARIDCNDPDRLDVTCAGAARARLRHEPSSGGPFAPPGWLLAVAKGRPGALGRLPPWVRRPAPDEPVRGGSAWYTETYTAVMRRSYRQDRRSWDALLARDRVVLVCYCVDVDACHRLVLARILEKLGAIYAGEIPRPGGGRHETAQQSLFPR
jgi:hypothetical protein